MHGICKGSIVPWYPLYILVLQHGMCNFMKYNNISNVHFYVFMSFYVSYYFSCMLIRISECFVILDYKFASQIDYK